MDLWECATSIWFLLPSNNVCFGTSGLCTHIPIKAFVFKYPLDTFNADYPLQTKHVYMGVAHSYLFFIQINLLSVFQPEIPAALAALIHLSFTESVIIWTCRSKYRLWFWWWRYTLNLNEMLNHSSTRPNKTIVRHLCPLEELLVWWMTIQCGLQLAQVDSIHYTSNIDSRVAQKMLNWDANRKWW